MGAGLRLCSLKTVSLFFASSRLVLYHSYDGGGFVRLVGSLVLFATNVGWKSRRKIMYRSVLLTTFYLHFIYKVGGETAFG